MERDFEVEVVIKVTHIVTANSKKEAKTIVKNGYLEDYGFLLDSSEIISIK